MDDCNEILREIASTDETVALATIIHVEGSAYRKEGTMMLFSKKEQTVGMISVGCLEEDLQIRANHLLQQDQYFSERVVYDMSAEDDLGWGRGVGCNGKVHILLEKIQFESDQHKHLIKVYETLKEGMDVIAVKSLHTVPSIIPTNYYIQNKNEMFGSESSFDEDSFQEKRSNKLIGHTYFHHFKPNSRLFIFGAGADVRPLATIAEQTGFNVHIWDWRATLLCEKTFPKAIFIHDDSLEDIIFTYTDSIVIMTHDFQKDKQLVQKLLSKKPYRYFGILGPRKRTTRLLDGKEIPEFIHSPVGLAIGAEGAEEIAISIVADLIRVKRGALSHEPAKDHRDLFSSRSK